MVLLVHLGGENTNCTNSSPVTYECMDLCETVRANPWLKTRCVLVAAD